MWFGALTVLSLATTLVVAPAGPSGATTSSTGTDVSFPGCGMAFPASPAFGIVGLNDGLANDLNPCLGPDPSYRQSELYWAVATSTGGTAQPKASLYVNTGDPGNVMSGTVIADWPASGATPYGTCATTTAMASSGPVTVGQSSDACAWEYGYRKGSQDARWLSAAAAGINATGPPVAVPGSSGSYPWWLDVETANTWQAGTTGQAMNVADLQGTVAALQAAGARSVGVYSTAAQWDRITGAPSSALGSIGGLDEWITGASTVTEATASCGLSPFTTGAITLSQWTSGSGDGDVACGTSAPPPPAFGGLDAPVVGMAATPNGQGYWLVTSKGQVQAHGDAPYYGGATALLLNQPIVGIAPSEAATGVVNGYWLDAADGGIFSFGTAGFYGSMGGRPLNEPMVSMAPTPDGKGYWTVAADGGIFAFGDAQFYGSMGGQPLNAPVVGMAVDESSGGYWLVASDGGVFSFNAPFYGSMGGQPLNAPIEEMEASPTGGGYRFVAKDGGVFDFDLPFEGSLGGLPPADGIAAMAAGGSTGYWLAEPDGIVHDFGSAPNV